MSLPTAPPNAFESNLLGTKLCCTCGASSLILQAKAEHLQIVGLLFTLSLMLGSESAVLNLQPFVSCLKIHLLLLDAELNYPLRMLLLRRQQGTTNKSRALVFTCRC